MVKKRKSRKQANAEMRIRYLNTVYLEDRSIQPEVELKHKTSWLKAGERQPSAGDLKTWVLETINRPFKWSCLIGFFDLTGEEPPYLEYFTLEEACLYNKAAEALNGKLERATKDKEVLKWAWAWCLFPVSGGLDIEHFKITWLSQLDGEGISDVGRNAHYRLLRALED